MIKFFIYHKKVDFQDMFIIKNNSVLNVIEGQVIDMTEVKSYEGKDSFIKE